MCPSFLPSLKFLALPGQGSYHERKHITVLCCLCDSGSSSFTPRATGMNDRLWLCYNSFCHVSIWLNLPLVLFPFQTEMPPHRADETRFLEVLCFSSSKLNAWVRHEPYVQNIFRKIWGKPVPCGSVLSLGVTTATYLKLVCIPPCLEAECVLVGTSRGCRGIIRRAMVVCSTLQELCTALIPGMSPGHSDPSHSLSVVLPNLGWTPRLMKSLCRGRGRTWRG